MGLDIWWQRSSGSMYCCSFAITFLDSWGNPQATQHGSTCLIVSMHGGADTQGQAIASPDMTWGRAIYEIGLFCAARLAHWIMLANWPHAQPMLGQACGLALHFSSGLWGRKFEHHWFWGVIDCINLYHFKLGFFFFLPFRDTICLIHWKGTLRLNQDSTQHILNKKVVISSYEWGFTETTSNNTTADGS